MPMTRRFSMLRACLPWSKAPRQLQAVINSVAAGCGLHLCTRNYQTTDRYRHDTFGPGNSYPPVGYRSGSRRPRKWGGDPLLPQGSRPHLKTRHRERPRS